MNAPTPIHGLSEVFARYDGFILDLWGVVHDGVKPFPTTVEALTLLKKSKKKVWLLSNAPRRASIIINKLTQMGIAPEMYDGALTSGEACWHALQDELLEKWGRRCFHLGSRERDSSIYDGLDIEIVSDPAAADFVLNSGIENFSDTLEKYAPALQNCALHNLPMLCANPDRIVHVEEKLVICAGTLADAYAALGGDVTWYGKPYRTVYSRCLESMGVRQVLAVGDSMVTDIAGATGTGLDSALVTSGIHREEFRDGGGLQGLLKTYPYRPTYIMPAFAW